MARRLVKKAAAPAADKKDYPEKSPNGADLVYVDDNGVAHYQDGAVWTPSDPETSKEADEEPEEDENTDEPDDEENDDEEDDPTEEADEEESDDEVGEEREPSGNDDGVEKKKLTKNNGASYSVNAKKSKMSAKAAAAAKGSDKNPRTASDPDDDGDDDSNASGDTDHDVWNADGSLKVKKNDAPEQVGLDALRLSAALVEKVQDIFSFTELSKREQAYEDAMLNFNAVMDTAAQNWLAGSSVSKRDDSSETSEAVDAITKVYESVIESVGGTPVSKSDEKQDIFKGLTPEAAEIVKRSQALLEEREVEKFEGVAKSFGNVSADTSALGAALRSLHTSNPEGYKTVTEALASANANLEDSEVFKSLGRPGDDTNLDPIVKRAKEMVSKGEAKDEDEATLKLMEQDPAKFYVPTNQVVRR